MKARLLTIALVALLAAPALLASNTALTAGGVLYVVEPPGEGNAAPDAIVLSRRIGKAKETLLVPASTDKASENNVQLEYDRVGDRLYVIWNRQSDDDSQILVSSLDGEGAWSDARVIARGDGSERLGNLRVALTRAEADGVDYTLLHAAWWRKSNEYVAEYALVAFDGAEHVSTDLSNLDELAAVTTTLSSATEIEPMGKALFPPMAMAALPNGVDVVFGASRSTKMTRVVVEPRLVPNARVWRPGKNGGHGMPPSLIASKNAASVQAMIVGNRLILYTLEDEFRFVVFANGKWSPIRSISLDESLTREQVLSGLYRLSGD